MKIDNSIKTLGNLPSANDSRNRTVKEQSTPQAVDAGTKVELSSLSSSLQKMESTIANVPVVNSSRVAELKKAIAEGRYQVNPESLANAMLQNAQQMLQSQTGASAT